MGSLLDIDSSTFSDAFARRSIAVGHGLVDHPLFTLDAIAELADRLPPDSVRRERGNLPLVNRDGYVDIGEGPPSATIRDVERNGFRISLRDIQQDRQYAELIDECLDEVEGILGDREGGMRRRTGYLFITAPASNTPMHFDPEHSFLLQVRGVKHVSVAAFEDDSIRQRELDLYYDAEECDFAAMEEVAEDFRIDSGVGVYLPVVRAALGHDRGRHLGVVLDPLLHGVQRAGRVRQPDQPPAAQARPLAPRAGQVRARRPREGGELRPVGQAERGAAQAAGIAPRGRRLASLAGPWALGREWLELAARHEGSSYFQTPDWVAGVVGHDRRTAAHAGGGVASAVRQPGRDRRAEPRPRAAAPAPSARGAGVRELRQRARRRDHCAWLVSPERARPWPRGSRDAAAGSALLGAKRRRRSGRRRSCRRAPGSSRRPPARGGAARGGGGRRALE